MSRRPPVPYFGFPAGAKVYVDGNALATVVQYWPEGSAQQTGAHYTVRYLGDNGIVRVKPCRVGIKRKH